MAHSALDARLKYVEIQSTSACIGKVTKHNRIIVTERNRCQYILL